MYELTIRKSCRVIKTLQIMQMAYGFIIDYHYKSIVKVYGFDVAEVPVIEEEIIIRKKVFIHG